MQFLITVGLQASGKTTWTEQHSCSNTYNSNRDDLRIELYGTYQTTISQEKAISKIQNERVLNAIQNKMDIIISDTNLNSKTQDKWKCLASQYNYDFVIKDFRDIDLNECINRDSKRYKKVGLDVIINTHNKYIRPTLYKHNSNKVGCARTVIFDIDGTLAKMKERQCYDWDKVKEDEYIEPIFEILEMYIKNNYTILFLSGRMDCCYKDTYNWLKKRLPDLDIKLAMRKTNDMRPDYIIKKEIFMNEIDLQYNVKYCFDDRLQIVNLWRDLGITTLQVDDGFF